ncbi:MAG TPA: anti-sigma factor, partial [Herpetosiphonaceae bacterium]|nr:anti-sigma factor [Herpetosiphonaceae bacterium]
QAALGDYRQVTARLDQSIPLVEAPNHLAERLRRQLGRERRRRALRSPGWWAGLSALVLLLALGGYAFSLRQTVAEQTARLHALEQASPTPAAVVIALVGRETGAQGELIWTPGQAEAALVLEGLPPLEKGESYYLWLIRKDGRADHVARYPLTAPATLRTSVSAPVPWSDYAQILITSSHESTLYEPPREGILEGTFQ